MNLMMERVLIRWNGNCSRERYRLNSKLSSQDPYWQTGSALSYHPSPAHSYHINQPLAQLPNPHHCQFSCQIINTPNKSGSNPKSMNIDSSKKQPFAIQSYSAAVKRAADAPQVLLIWISMHLSATLISIKGIECTFEGGKFELCKWYKEQQV